MPGDEAARSSHRLLCARIAGQSGLVTRQQALQAGITDEEIRWKIASARWVRVHPGVYLTEPGRDDWEVHAVAALLFMGRPAALCGPSAAHAWGLTASAGESIHVIVPAGRRSSTRPGIVVTRSRRFHERVHPDAWPHRTTVEHTVFDRAMGTSLDRAVALMAKACQLQQTDETRLRSVLASRPNQTHFGLLTEILADFDGIESSAELRYQRDVVAAHGLPAGHRQEPGAGRTSRDVDHPDLAVIVEINGRLGHEGWLGQQRDGRRDRVAAVQGRLTVRVFWIDVAHTPCQLGAELAQIFTSRGWAGLPHRCARPGCALDAAAA
ncbi:type IV toxin-antitoxin system AbiEi family antitoxin domain-containing protein [Intrasporangium sp.]|uniref:type IV toxin-antitoxin system AbiEi family antitoxin domain-containing protein n=1 Tax=Intrasporangium sp. TaxID=1925024 RepID=UPI0033658872